MVLLYRLKLLQELVFIVSRHSVLFSGRLHLAAVEFDQLFVVIRIVERGQLAQIVIVHHLTVTKVILFILVAFSLILRLLVIFIIISSLVEQRWV